jgi:hypothetical protein
MHIPGWGWVIYGLSCIALLGWWWDRLCKQGDVRGGKP